MSKFITFNEENITYLIVALPTKTHKYEIVHNYVIRYYIDNYKLEELLPIGYSYVIIGEYSEIDVATLETILSVYNRGQKLYHNYNTWYEFTPDIKKSFKSLMEYNGFDTNKERLLILKQMSL